MESLPIQKHSPIVPLVHQVSTCVLSETGTDLPSLRCVLPAALHWARLHPVSPVALCRSTSSVSSLTRPVLGGRGRTPSSAPGFSGCALFVAPSRFLLPSAYKTISAIPTFILCVQFFCLPISRWHLCSWRPFRKSRQRRRRAAPSGRSGAGTPTGPGSKQQAAAWSSRGSFWAGNSVAC